ncbi:MAG: hypothetical protein A2W98_14790 [Bacteroidetes bacterium GWF2_33_38]|nr:MAG: hypothetical protein A2W98_14790 [Bacteroidetes bacterium GWF2_33_38]OFY75761.1 MAG: hypothetical protein A2265_09965 [Bacteroidetes bacterium RIFOXYA12_FULL_33_9]OFY91321.1 MAG: hypothetical protein A2236_13690 [Bacteroidetes bacterium RIFOXYA2_FULL_33_7]
MKYFIKWIKFFAHDSFFFIVKISSSSSIFDAGRVWNTEETEGLKIHSMQPIIYQLNLIQYESFELYSK